MNTPGLIAESKIIVPIYTPVMSLDKLADIWTSRENNLDGDVRIACLLTMRQRITTQISSGIVPSFHIGKRIAINIAQLAQNDANALTAHQLKIQFSLLISSMPVDTFAEHAGYDLNVVAGWIKKGYLPSNKHGSYRVINMLHLLERCLNWRADQWAGLVPKPKARPALQGV